MLKNLDETVRLQSEKREEWIQKIGGERLQGIAEGTSSALCLANSSAASFSGRNECPGTHRRLIKQEEIEDSPARSAGEIDVKVRCRKGQRKSDGRRELANLLMLPSQQRACRMAQAVAEKLEHTGPAEKVRVASVP